jgi:hypothetical protein
MRYIFIPRAESLRVTKPVDADEDHVSAIIRARCDYLHDLSLNPLEIILLVPFIQVCVERYEEETRYREKKQQKKYGFRATLHIQPLIGAIP